MVTHYGRSQFESIEAMNEYIVSTWNSVVGTKDVVYIVGDFSFGEKEETMEVCQRLNGTKILYLGNHDKRTKRHFTTLDFLEIGFKEVYEEDVLKLSNGIEVLVKHYPYSDSGLKLLFKKLFKQQVNEKTYHNFFPVDRGLYHIHGHFHGGPKIKGRQINVSAETLNYKPISEGDICKLINDHESRTIKNRIRYLKKRLIGKLAAFKETIFKESVDEFQKGSTWKINPGGTEESYFLIITGNGIIPNSVKCLIQKNSAGSSIPQKFKDFDRSYIKIYGTFIGKSKTHLP